MNHTKKVFPVRSFKASEIKDALDLIDIDYKCKNLMPNVRYEFASIKCIKKPNLGFYFSVNGYAASKKIENSLILTNSECDASGENSLLIVDDPQLIYYKLMRFFFENKKESFIHPTAIISPNAYIGENVYIGPNCIIEDCIINDNVHLHSSINIMAGTTIGSNVYVDSGVNIGITSVAWAWDAKNKTRVIQPQIGYTSIGNNCFIGASCSIAKGSINETTTIGSNVVIAQGVRIAHGCIIGDDCHFGNNVSLSGNVTIGKKSFIGSGCAIRSMVSIANKNIIGVGAVVVKDTTDENMMIIGVPAKAKPISKDRLSGVPDVSKM